MSTPETYTDNSASALERRRHVRQRLRPLAYLDIGADNGGIILDLSDEGMGIQTVAPLNDQKEVDLRIRLTHPQAHLESAAEIIWLSPGHQQAGVRFLGMSSEARVQIHEWIRAQLSPSGPWQKSASRIEAVGDSPRKQEAAQATRKDKWLSLMDELEGRQPLVENPQSVEMTKETGHASPMVQADSRGFIAHRNVLTDAGQKETPIHGARSNAKPPAAIPPAAIPHDALEGSASPGESVEPPASVAGANAQAATKASAMSVPFPPTRSSNARRWPASAILLASICVLCFGIGMWVRHPDNHTALKQPPGEPRVVVPDVVAKGTRSKRPRVNREKVHAHDATASSVMDNRQHKVALTASPPAADSNPPSNPAKESSTPLMTAKPAENKPPSASAPATQASDPSLVVPRIVAGRKLRPSDRFNPCHLTYRVEPAYPAVAQQQRIEGAVKIHQVIGADGSVQSIKLLTGPPLLVPAAMEAAKYWRYLPALLNGQPVETEQDIEINFRLPR